MNQRVNIPVRVIRPSEYQAVPPVPSTPTERPAPASQPAVPKRPARERSPVRAGLQAELEAWRQKAVHLQAQVEQQRVETERLELALEKQASGIADLQSALEKRSYEAQRLNEQLAAQEAEVEQIQAEAEKRLAQAARLQAEMDNFRKRQQRLAADQTETERRRLLADYLHVVDDLERALSAPDRDDEALRQGVALTHRAALKLLQREGVEPVQAMGQPFDPNWHEAVATVSALDAAANNGRQPDSDTVIQVLEPGYRQGDRLLRPARVVVAVES